MLLHYRLNYFFYKIDNRHINLIERLDEPATWTTEVPLTKLYAALEDGESLTSMYVRINDNVTNSQIESADVMEDPLIRCLFTGAFGSYQKAQLKRLKSLKKQVRRLSPV